MARNLILIFILLMGLVSILFHYFCTRKVTSLRVYSIPRVSRHDADQVVNTSYGNFQEYLQLYQGKEGKYFVDSPSCHIAKTPLLPPFFQKPWPLFVTPRCDYEKKLYTIQDEVLKILPEFRHYNCCIRQIQRKRRSDKRISLSDCVSITSGNVSVASSEYFVVKCGEYMNFDMKFLEPKSVRRKTSHWDKIGRKGKINVVILGIDSTSRAHAYRSLPQTMRLLKKNGFVDFKGFHSVGPSTVYNMVALLTGMTPERLMPTCQAGTESPYDNCSFIWKEFSDADYLTQFIEDGEQSFNWGNRGGFLKKPVDFYAHPLFLAINKLRSSNKLVRKYPGTLYRDCVSNETVPNFVLRQLKTFLQKFQRYPAFSFTFLTHPFHDRLYALNLMDGNISDFFQWFLQNKGQTRNTLFIFWSDHGDRFHFSKETKSITAYIERSLPFLFIRLPEILKQRYQDALNHNSNQLTSPFDIYQTMKHVLRLEDNDFQPVISNRSSLLVRLPPNRDCQSTNVQLHTCACDVSADKTVPVSTFLKQKMLDIAVESLNYIVITSKYAAVCARWKSRLNLVQYVQRVKKSKSSSHYIFGFKAIPGMAMFETKLVVRHVHAVLDRIYIGGKFSRLSLYGSQSICIGNETARDKIMKELCFCVSQLSKYQHKKTKEF